MDIEDITRNPCKYSNRKFVNSPNDWVILASKVTEFVDVSEDLEFCHRLDDRFLGIGNVSWLGAQRFCQSHGFQSPSQDVIDSLKLGRYYTSRYLFY